ncbi:hypothetical protein CsatB_027724 [Cannabis sativa]
MNDNQQPITPLPKGNKSFVPQTDQIDQNSSSPTTIMPKGYQSFTMQNPSPPPQQTPTANLGSPVIMANPAQSMTTPFVTSAPPAPPPSTDMPAQDLNHTKTHLSKDQKIQK